MAPHQRNSKEKSQGFGKQSRKKSEKQAEPSKLTAQQPVKLSTSIPFAETIKDWPAGTHPVPKPFGSLSNDIALCIFDGLKDPLDQVCFALTTKSLWALLRSKVHLTKFELPLILPPRVTRLRGVIRPWPYFMSSRWRLLERLEDCYWKCCAGCLRLHPKTEFFPSEIWSSPGDRYCRAPGLVQLCPHLYLTHKKCMKLHQMMLAAAKGTDNKVIGNFSVNEALGHICDLGRRSVNTKLTITLQPFLSPKLKQLMFHNTYNVRNFPIGKVKESLERFSDAMINPCPHHSLIQHCADMSNGREWNSTAVDGNLRDMSQALCVNCQSLYYNYRSSVHKYAETQMVEFNANRTMVGDSLGLGECCVGYGDFRALQS